MHLRKNEFYDIMKAWWKKMQNKRIVHDFEKVKTNTEERKEKKCLLFASMFIDMKI